MPREVYSMQHGFDRKQFTGIQALRGVAACMVVIYHSTQSYTLEHPGSVWESGAAGVDLFFAISGFVMAISCLGKSGLSASTFLKGRVVRIVPMYWLATACVALKMILEQTCHPIFAGMEHAEITAPYLISSFLFIPFRNSLGIPQPIVIVGWTLCFEMLFYALIAIALLFRISVVRFVFTAIISLSIAGAFATEAPEAVRCWTHPIMFEFLGGLLLGDAYLKGFRLNTKWSLSIGLVGAALIMTFTPSMLSIYRPIEWGIPALLIVLAAVMLEGPLSRFTPSWMLILGSASYSLYLTPCRPLFIMTLSKRISSASLPFPEAITSALSLAASIAIAMVVYRHIESPMTRTLKQAMPSLLLLRVDLLTRVTELIRSRA